MGSRQGFQQGRDTLACFLVEAVREPPEWGEAGDRDRSEHTGPGVPECMERKGRSLSEKRLSPSCFQQMWLSAPQ